MLFGRFYAVIGDLKQLIKKHGLKIAVIDYWSIAIQWVILYIGTIIYSAYRTVVTGTMLYGDCVVVINNIVSTASAIKGVVDGYMKFHENSLSVDNIKTFLEYEPKICDNPDGLTCSPDCSSLSIENVGFRYDPSGRDILKNISFTVKPGEKIALVGQNGAGKSTLVKLLLRLYDPSDGEIKLNGYPIKDYRLKAYRNLFATVFQQYRVFSLSVLQNILLRENITQTDRENALLGMKKSGVYGKVSSLPREENTVLTREFDPKGAVLSGGENQKIAIARVFTRDCRFVILDEPSSALDPIAEYKMYEAMLDACCDKAMIYISHRLSSAVLADTVLLLENGEIVERGSHSELLAQNGKYADMWKKQAEQYKTGVKTYA